MELRVDIEITPHPKEIAPRQMDDLLNGELVDFERWFIARQQGRGLTADGLIGAERGIIKAYLIYAATSRRGEAVA